MNAVLLDGYLPEADGMEVAYTISDALAELALVEPWPRAGDTLKFNNLLIQIEQLNFSAALHTLINVQEW